VNNWNNCDCFKK